MAVCSLYAARHWALYDGFIGASRDEAVYLPAILKNSDPSLYVNDYFLNNFQLATPFFLDFSSGLLNLSGGDYRWFLLASSTVLLFVFISGVFVMVRDLAGNPAAALFAGLLLLRPREATGGVGFAVYLGNYQPRIFIDAITPWLFWALLRARTPLGHAGIGAALGLTSCFYPVYPLQLAALFALMLLFMKRGRAAALLLLAFAVPFMACHFRVIMTAAQPLTESAVQAINYRWGGQLYPDARVIFLELFRNFTLPLLLAIAGYAAFPGSLSESPKLRYFLFSIPAVALLIAAAYASYAVPAALPVMPQRLGRLYHLVFLSIGAIGASALFKKEGVSRMKGLLIGLMAVNFFYTSPLPVPGREEKAREVMSGGDKDDFLAVAEAARALTPEEAVFMVPPQGLDNFQLYSQRAIVVSYKTLSSIRDAKILKYWHDAYRDVSDAYRSGDPGEVKRAALSYGADYFLLTGNTEPAEPPVFKRGKYSVYKAGGT